MRTKEKENGCETETRTRSYAIAGTVAIAIALIAAMMVITPASAGFEPGECDIYVHSGQSIDAAVDSASDGQTVCVYNGTYSGYISINTPNITVKGEGADVVTYQDDTFYIVFSDTGDASGCIIEGL